MCQKGPLTNLMSRQKKTIQNQTTLTNLQYEIEFHAEANSQTK